MSKFEVICRSEYEDYQKLLIERNLSTDDFTLTEQEDAMKGVGLRLISGRVTVQNKKTRQIKTYEAGNGTAWVSEFRKDLVSGFFAGTDSEQ